MCREMRDSGIQWIGKIPQGWKLIKYKYFATSGMGETILSERLSDDGVPVYSATQSDKVFGYLKNPNLILKRGDLVIPARGNSIGCVSIIKDEIATCTQTTIYSRIDGISREYLYYCCNGLKDNWFEFDNTAIPQITVNQVQNNIVPVPEEYEQIKIANYLDKKVSQIDDIISKQKSLIEKYKAYKQSLITETVTKGLNKNVPMKDSGIEWIGEIPSHWNVKKMKNVVDIIMGQSPNSDDIKDNGNILFMQGNVEFGEKYPNPSIYCDKCNKHSRIGDILMSVRAPIGALNFADKQYGIGRGLCSIGVKDELSINYLWYYLQKSKKDFNYYSNGSTFDAITITILNNFYIVVPNLKEQQEITDFLDKKCNVIDSVICKKEHLIEKLESYKKSLIYECVTGKRAVN